MLDPGPACYDNFSNEKKNKTIEHLKENICCHKYDSVCHLYLNRTSNSIPQIGHGIQIRWQLALRCASVKEIRLFHLFKGSRKNVLFTLTPPPRTQWPQIFRNLFFELQKKFFFLFGYAFTSPPPLLVARPLKKLLLRLP